jgi:P27 family predicted phage terminase small subunit
MARGRKAEITAIDGALSAVPPAPAWLPKHGKTEWRRVLVQLVADRKIAAYELQTVESYCLAVARIREAEAILQVEGLTLISPSGEIKRRPETTILKENVEAARRLASELGLTPASRSKNKGGAPGADDNEFGVDL